MGEKFNMKICFITDDIFTLGGVQRVVSVLADNLSNEYDVTVLCAKNTKINRKLYNINSKLKIDVKPEIFKVNILDKAIRKIIKDINKKFGFFNKEKYCEFLANVYYPKKIRRNLLNYFNANNYDVIIGVEGIYSILLGYMSNDIKCKTIGWQHNSYDAYLNNENRYYWNLDILFEKYIKKLNEYIVLTEYDKNMFEKEKNIECKVIYNPKSFKSKDKSALKNKQFLAAGRFTEQKGFDLLIQSFNLFCKKNSDWNLIIVGEGEEKTKIEELINKFNLNDRIIVEGFTDNIKKYFLQSSVLLLPSRWEGMPMIVLESFEMGVPVISYDISASKQLITNEKEGILVDKYNIERFSQAMLEISDNYELRRSMGNMCLKKSEKYDIENIISFWKEIIS